MNNQKVIYQFLIIQFWLVHYECSNKPRVVHASRSVHTVHIAIRLLRWRAISEINPSAKETKNRAGLFHFQTTLLRGIYIFEDIRSASGFVPPSPFPSHQAILGRTREREEGQTFRIKLRHFLSLLFSLSWVYTPPYNLPEKVIGVINVLRDATSSRCRNRFCLLHHSRERFPAQKVAQSLSLLCVCF